MKKRLFVVHIEEVLSRDVVISAYDNYQAEEIADELCGGGKIDLNGTDFTSRTVESLRIADEKDTDLQRYID